MTLWLAASCSSLRTLVQNISASRGLLNWPRVQRAMNAFWLAGLICEAYQARPTGRWPLSSASCTAGTSLRRESRRST